MPSFIGKYRNVNAMRVQKYVCTGTYIYKKNSQTILHQNKNDKYSIIKSYKVDTFRNEFIILNL